MNEIVVGGSDSLVHAFTLDGSELDGFPYATGNWIIGSPAVGDIDNDGDLEVVITSRDWKIHVIQHDGSGEAIATAESYLMGTPALSDLDSDGDLEIVVAGFGYDVLAVHHDGTSLDNFPLTIEGGRMSCAVAIADLNNDGSKDIVVGTWGDNLHAYDLNGDLLPGFPLDMISNVASAPVITDLNNDGAFEIVVGQDGGNLYAVAADGSVMWTHSISAASIRTAPAVWDFDGDGNMEIVYTTLAGDIEVVDHEGNSLTGWPQSLGGSCYSSPVTADVDGDGATEIVVGSNSGEVFIFRLDGTTLDLFPLALAGPVRGTPTVADLSQDGTLEIVVGTDEDLTIINLKMLAEEGPNWSTDRGSLLRTGFYNPHVLSVNNYEVPEALSLKQNYPNPFNPSTSIEFAIPAEGLVTLKIYDVLGHEVNQLVNANLEPGNYSAVWNGKDAAAQSMATGIYFARIQAAGSEQIVKMMLIK